VSAPDVTARPAGLPEPRRPLLVATVVFVLAALTLCWPMFQGKFLAGPLSDQFEAGYSFRHFAAVYFKAHGSIPLWDPYILGGLPFVGAAHGDIFYPTAWLRWIMATDTAMNLGFAIHIVLAGITMYGFLRALRLGWSAALVGGLGYELSGMVVSQVHPGHDGKLFVSAMAPLLLLGILLAVRDRKLIGYAVIALATGLALQGHPQSAYYLLVAGAVWGAFLLFGWAEGPKGADRARVAAAAVGAVALGIGLYAIYALPMAGYVPFSPRAAGGASSGWDYMTGFSMPIQELLSTLLPRFDGGTTPTYFGLNGLKLHGEYIGPIVLLLALLGLSGPERRRERVALGVIGGLFLLVALGRHTPFYRLWYEVMPMMKKVRAPGMAFYLPSLVVSAFAGLGVERLFSGPSARKRLLIGAGVIGALALLGAIGGLQGAAEDMARSSPYQGMAELAIANGPVLRLDALRLLAAVIIGGGILLAITTRRLRSTAGVALLAVALVADLYLVDRDYFVYSPGAEITYANDPAMAKMAETPLPYRTWAPSGVYDQALNPYPRSWLMAAGIPTLFGYHGNELRFFDDLFGGKNDWRNQVNPNLLRLYAVRYAALKQPQQIPGFHDLLGPATTALGDSVWLYEADTVPPYAWVVRGAAKVPDDQLTPTVNDPRFPIDRLVVLPDTASVTPAPLGGAVPGPSAVQATVTAWQAGKMSISLAGADSAESYLVVAENWYKDWEATVDAKPATVVRGDNAVITVALPPGARQVELEYRSPEYRTGRAISLASLAGVLGLFLAAAVRSRRADA
jgi:hypothetical protein